jgi:serine/threonine-protein kinase
MACGTPQTSHPPGSPSPSVAALPTLTITDRPLINTGGFIALGPDGNLYVSSGDGPGPRITEVSPDGKPLMQFSGFTDDSGVQGVAVDSHGNVYGADQGSNDVVEFSSGGKLITRIGTSAISEPGGLAVDSQDSLYIADEGKNAIMVFSSSHRLIRTIQGTFGKVRGLYVDAQDQIFVVDHDNGTIQKLDPNGKRLAVWGSGADTLSFSYPIEITQDGSGNLFVTDPGDLAVQKLGPDGTVLGKWKASSNHHPIAIVALPDGTTYATEDDDAGKTARVVKRSPAGLEVVAWS